METNINKGANHTTDIQGFVLAFIAFRMHDLFVASGESCEM